MLKQEKLYVKYVKYADFEWFLRKLLYLYAMLYAKMFHGRDILKHGKEWLDDAVKPLFKIC